MNILAHFEKTIAQLKAMDSAQIKALASKSGLTERTIWRIRGGTEPKIATYQALIDALKKGIR